VRGLLCALLTADPRRRADWLRPAVQAALGRSFRGESDDAVQATHAVLAGLAAAAPSLGDRTTALEAAAAAGADAAEAADER
jgi:hypothetical protein